jgi:hypothetical protein
MYRVSKPIFDKYSELFEPFLDEVEELDFDAIRRSSPVKCASVMLTSSGSAMGFKLIKVLHSVLSPVIVGLYGFYFANLLCFFCARIAF